MKTELIRLTDLVAEGAVIINDGYRTKRDELGTAGIPILRVSEVQDGRLNPSICDFVREEYRPKMGEKTSKSGDVVVTTKGTVGRVAVIRAEDPEFVYSPQVCFVRVLDSNRVCPGYMYQWFRGPEFTQQSLVLQSQTDMAPYINLADFRGLSLSLPSIGDQVAITDVLGALDDKIDSNRRLISSIEQLVPLIFSTMTGNCEMVPLPEVAWLQKGISYRSVDLEDSDTAMVTLKSYDRNGGYKADGLKPYVGKYKPEQVLLPGEMAVAQTDLTQGAEVVGRVIRIPRQDHFRTLVASLDLVVVRPRVREDEIYLYGALLQEDFREHCRSRTSGTTVLHLGSDALPKYTVPWANDEVRRAFDYEVRPLLEKHDSLTSESSTLAQLRDALLPELLSGRLRVRDAESMLDNAR